MLSSRKQYEQQATAAPEHRPRPDLYIGPIKRLLGRTRATGETREVYREWPTISNALVETILDSLIPYGDQGCSEHKFYSLLPFSKEYLTAALGQLGEDGLVSHRITSIHWPFGIHTSNTISYAITAVGRQYLMHLWGNLSGNSSENLSQDPQHAPVHDPVVPAPVKPEQPEYR